MILLYIDDREPAKIINQVKEIISDVEICRLDTADYAMPDFAAERKTPQDLLGSVYDGRYWTQLAKMKSAYPHSVVIIEGNPNETFFHRGSEKIHHNPVLIRSVEISTIMKWGIPVMYTTDYIKTASLIGEFYAKSEKKSEKPRAVVKKEADPEKIRLSMMQSIEGLGPMGASRVLAKFTFRDLVDVDDPNILCKSVVGMSRKVSERIVKVFNK